VRKYFCSGYAFSGALMKGKNNIQSINDVINALHGACAEEDVLAIQFTTVGSAM
jgi:hypothetical protein